MKKHIKILCLIFCTVFAFTEINAYGDGPAYSDYPLWENAVSKGIEGYNSQDYQAGEICVYECTTGTVLFEKNSEEKVKASHSAKLMTLYIAGEKIRAGKLNFDEKVRVSEKANSQPAPQIWLDKGEKISVEELIKSITVGNSNDGCVALAEKISGSEEKFVSLMNKKARELEMNSTEFADCTGISEKTFSSAKDMALLTAGLFDFPFFKKYLTCWRDTVRQGKAKLVNLNRFVRFYNGIQGFKFWSDSGIAGAVRGKMKICAVALDCKTTENRDSDVRKLLDTAFENYRLFSPEIPKDFLKEIKVTGGEESKADVCLKKIPVIVISKNDFANVKCEFKRNEMLTAPVKKGKCVGKLICTLGDRKIIETNLCTKEEIKEMNVKCGLEKIWLNLLNLK